MTYGQLKALLKPYAVLLNEEVLIVLDQDLQNAVKRASTEFDNKSNFDCEQLNFDVASRYRTLMVFSNRYHGTHLPDIEFK
ncbi:MAG: hypothetical protein Q7K40_03485 [bacterium]|nr:hypothetical protein [bacterium]